jgi:hypothetical protein
MSSRRSPRHSLPPQERGLYSKVRQLLDESGLLRGNLVEVRRLCGKPTCRCRQDPALRHRALYLGVSLEGKHRMIYIPADWEERVQKWVARYAKVQDVLEQISRMGLSRLKERE